MRILIVEEALQSGKGHWPNYIGDLAGEFRRAGDQVDVLVHRDALDPVVEKVGGTRWMTRNCWVDPRSQGKLGGFRHNWSFYRDLRRWFRAQPSSDWVLALTMRLQHLLAFAAVSRCRWVPRDTRFLLLFVQGFGEYREDGSPTTFPQNLSNRLAAQAFRVMAAAVRSGRVVIAAETAGMQDEIQRFTGLPVQLFPHPVHNRSADATLIQPETSRERLTVSCPGFARHEKGSDLLQDAIVQILAGPYAERFHFVLQWPEPFALPDGVILDAHPSLRQHPSVEFIDGNLDAVAYGALLDRSDFVILPYRRNSYHHRLSRVAIEAAGKGIPLIHTSRTWTDEVAEIAGGATPIHHETSQGIADALVEAADHAESRRAAARMGAAAIRKLHSAESFRRALPEAPLS